MNGDEVHKYHTDPLKRDTDGGGVSDGHEFSKTTPTRGSKGRLRLFELFINFDYDQAVQAAVLPPVGSGRKDSSQKSKATAVVEGQR